MCCENEKLTSAKTSLRGEKLWLEMTSPLRPQRLCGLTMVFVGGHLWAYRGRGCQHMAREVSWAFCDGWSKVADANHRAVHVSRAFFECW